MDSTYRLQFPTDVEDSSLPEGFMRNASGQVVQVEYCCRNYADGYDCACGEW
jgi:hypothetical protein